MVLSDDISGDDSFDDGTECDGAYVERREGAWESAEGVDHWCNKLDATDSCVYCKEQDAVGMGKVKSATHIRRRR